MRSNEKAKRALVMVTDIIRNARDDCRVKSPVLRDLKLLFLSEVRTVQLIAATEYLY